MTSLIDFLTQRFSEDQQIAKATADQGGPSWVEDYDRVIGSNPRGAVGYDMLGPVPVHIARHDPDRVLREVSAKRAVIDSLRSYITYVENNENGVDIEGELAEVLRPMAAIYSDHPDYDPAWSE